MTEIESIVWRQCIPRNESIPTWYTLPSHCHPNTRSTKKRREPMEEGQNDTFYLTSGKKCHNGSVQLFSGTGYLRSLKHRLHEHPRHYQKPRTRCSRNKNGARYIGDEKGLSKKTPIITFVVFSEGHVLCPSGARSLSMQTTLRSSFPIPSRR